MENRLCLNKRPEYELPDEVIVSEYRRHYKTPDFIADLCLCVWGVGNCGEVREYKQDAKQICIKTKNKELIHFIEGYNWKKEAHKTASSNLNMWKFKKIILEEFYNKKMKTFKNG